MILPVLIVFIIFFILILAKPQRRSNALYECAVGDKASSQELYYPASAYPPGYVPKPVSASAPMAMPMPKKTTPEEMMNVEQMTDSPRPSGHDDYNQFIINTGLESSVVDSHKVFAKEINTSTSGASAQTVFSHDDSIVPKWGLRRTSAYVPVSEHAREVPSSTTEQILENSHTMSYGLF